MKSPYKNFWLFAGAIPAVAIALDQATKYWATQFFKLPFNICEVDPYVGGKGHFYDASPVVDIAMTCNLGVSFGMLSGDSDIKRWGLTLFALAMVGGLLYILKDTKDTLSRLGLALIIGGALGNGIDRLFFGAVTDFISVGQLLPFFPWVFNIADSAITCGVIGIFLGMIFNKPETKPLKN